MAKLATYTDYLQSGHWLDLRSYMLKKWPYCWICGKSSTEVLMNVHHEFYGSLGSEIPNVDVFVLCHVCHKWVHYRLYYLGKVRLTHHDLKRRRLLLKTIHLLKNGRIFQAFPYYKQLVVVFAVEPVEALGPVGQRDLGLISLS